MSTFHFPSSGAAAVSPSFTLVGTAWGDTSQADRVRLEHKLFESVSTALTDKTVTVANAFTGNILVRQFVSDPYIRATEFSGLSSSGTNTHTGVIRCSESVLTVNAFTVAKTYLVSPDGTVGLLLNDLLSRDIEFTVDGSPSTRLFFNTAATNSTNQLPGSRLVVEMGVKITASTTSGTATMRFGNPAGTADFAQATGLTTDLCPWFGLSRNIFNLDNFNYKSVRVGDGMSVSERTW